MMLLDYVSCGGTLIPRMNSFFPELVHLIINIIKIGAPVLLIVLGMLDMAKGVMAQKEDEIKKAQGLFVKRLIAGVLVFLVFVVVELVFSLLANITDENNDNIWDCVACFVEGPGGKDSKCDPVSSSE